MRYRLRHGAGLLLTAALHVALLGALLSRYKPPQPSPPRQGHAIQWLRMTPPKAAEPVLPLPPPQQQAAAARTPAPRMIPARPAAAGVAIPPAAPAQDEEAAAPAPAASEHFQGDLSAAPVLNADEMLRIAKRDVGDIDKDLRKKSLHRIKPPDDSVRTRLDRNFQDARDAKAKWYEPAKITEISAPPGPGGGSRIYEVKKGGLRYCIYVTPQGGSQIKTCPRDK